MLLLRGKAVFMNRSVAAFIVASLFIAGAARERLHAQIPVTWDGGNARWESANWTKEGVSGLTAQDAMGDSTGGRGGLEIVIGGGAQVEYDPNPGGIGGLGDFKPRMDVTPGGSLTIKDGAVLTMDSHSDLDGRWMRIGLDIILDGGTLRRTHSAPSDSGGRMIFGYRNELLPDAKIKFDVINGGRVENDAKMVFGDPNLPPDSGHNPRIEVAMTINNGTLDLTGGADYPEFFGQADGELVFFYEYEFGVGPKNEKYSINFTGPGSITIDNGIYVVVQDSGGVFNAGAGGQDLFTPVTYQALWNEGILQANGQSGKTGAAFNTFFTTTGTVGMPNYTLTSLLSPAGVSGDYNDNGVVDAADYVLWRNGGPLENEVNNPGTVNQADYDAWRARFGNSSAGGSAAGIGGTVPEPSGLVCAIVLAAAWLARREGRWS
jgi:hypothetical protein